MKRKHAIQDSWLYRHRYPIAGVVLALIAAFMVSYRFWDVPTGLSQAEIESAATTVELYGNNPILHPTSHTTLLANLPWHVAQWLSVKLLGLSVMSLRLPAVLLTLMSVALLIFLIRRLIRPSMAMMTGLLLVSSSFMITIARSGTPAAMVTLLLILLLICAYYVLSATGARRRVAVVGLTVTSGLMCYMSGGVYILLMLLLVAVLHPQTRLIIRRGCRLIPLIIVGMVVITLPLIIAIAHSLISGTSVNSAVSLLLPGVPTLGGLADCLLAYAGLQASVVGGLITPMMTVVGAALVVVGLIYVTATARTSIRFYLLAGLIILALVLGSCNPDFVYLLFVPTIILEAAALSYITSQWYGLFPNNPYARVFAIVPIAILIGSLCSVDASRYFNAASYNRVVVYSYDQTLPVLVDFIKDNDDVSLGVVVPDSRDKYMLCSYLSTQYDNIEIVDSMPSGRASANSASLNSGAKVVIIGHDEVEVPDYMVLSDVRTGWTKEDSVVLRAYTVRADKSDESD